MRKSEQVEFLVKEGIIGIIRARDFRQLIKVIQAINEGGIKAIEVSMTTPHALEVIKEASAVFKDKILPGVGTVLDPETARLAILSGAEFVITPVLNKDVVRLCNRYGKIVISGALTFTEILTAWEDGADLVKIAPADAVGGPAYIKAIKGPLPHVPLVPAGGVTLDNAADYFKAGASVITVCSPFQTDKVLAEGKFDALTGIARRFVAVAREARKRNESIS
jgi:2-dehydro-3-deoxyphosphogluconate aldolase/(4S)-4-hydroxy-2-oxoglutarate aldolase